MESFLIKWKGRQEGPFTEPELREMLANREIKSMHEIQVEGEWKTIRSFFKELDRAAAPPRQSTPDTTPQPAPPRKPVPPEPESRSAGIPPALPVADSAADSVPASGPPVPETSTREVTGALGQETEDALVADSSKKAEDRPQTPPTEEQKSARAEPGKLPPPDISHTVLRQTRAGEFLVYAGFWNRLLAAIVDAFLVFALPLWILGFLFKMDLQPYDPVATFSEIASLGALGAALVTLAMVMIWIYFASMESSRKRATLGKQIFCLVVTDEQGERISFQRASKRFFAKFLSAAMIAAGFFLAAFTRKKQGFHDILSDCTVSFSFSPQRLLKRRNTTSR